MVVLSLLLSSVAGQAATRLRAKPMLRQDKEYNAILIHVAQYFVLTIPDDKTVGDIGNDISCSFVIAPDGSLRQIEIENSVDGWTGLFEGQGARRTEMWLRNAVLEGMQAVPAFHVAELRNPKAAKKRTVVFSFGRGGGGQATNVPFMGFNSDVVDNNLNQAMGEQRQAVQDGTADKKLPKNGLTAKQTDRLYFKQNSQWAGFTDNNIKETMKPKYEPFRQTPPPIIKPQPSTPQAPPPVEIAISLQ